MAATSTNQALTEDYSCGYCLQRLNYMIDPRELPCSHVFCLSCLQSAIKESREGTLVCTFCSTNHKLEDPSTLRKVLPPEVTDAVSESEVMSCDLCKNVENKAVCYCVGCDKKFCDQHLKNHEEFGLNHETVRIALFQSQPRMYQRESCPTHDSERILHTCGKCLKMFCSTCEMNLTCEVVDENGGDLRHDINNLEPFANKVRKEIKRMLKNLSDKITEISKQEKAAWRKLDDVETSIKEMVSEVERVAEEQIAAIRKSCADTKRDIADFQTRSAERVEKYTAGLMVEKQKLEDIWRSTHDLITLDGNARVVSSWKDSIKQIDDGLSTQLSQLKLQPGILKDSGVYRQLEKRFTRSRPPSHLILSVASNTDSRSVFWEDEDILLISGSCHTSRFGKKLNKLSSNSIMDIYSSIKAGDVYVVWHKNGGYGEINLYNNFRKFVKTIYSLRNFTDVSDAYQQLATGHENIIAADSNSNSLIIFDNKAGLSHISKIPDINRVRSICVLEDGGILATDFGGSSVYKYTLDGTNLVKVWKCDGLVKATGICSDEYGCIYVGSSEGCIYTLSAEGVLLETLRPAELQNVMISSLSVRKDLLAVACLHNGVKLYNALRD